MRVIAILVGTTYEYWRNLVWYIRGKSFAACPYLRESENRQARVQTASLALVMQAGRWVGGVGGNTAR